MVLAAGLSTRLGRPKQLEVLDPDSGDTLVERAVRSAIAAGLSPIVVVIRSEELLAPLQALGAIVLFNRQSYKGLASSIRVGVEAALQLELDGVVLMTCDQVALTADHLRELLTAPDRVTGSYYMSRIGVPAYFPRASFEALLQLDGDVGARELLRGARSVACEELALDVDTEQDLKRAREFVVKSRS
ncbi:molybdenum cofactor cytidylyltransferase [Bryocella elongata]|uniref:Molybdenum cofactor cytidylyltransferase n=1 Tax=Bryocella elongata TaxID=863522 RepID=A0A1H5WNQ2_9BACT|nr:molybdenum cofactor cytidylyltransferase [Bryocella elongata]